MAKVTRSGTFLTLYLFSGILAHILLAARE